MFLFIKNIVKIKFSCLKSSYGFVSGYTIAELLFTVTVIFVIASIITNSFLSDFDVKQLHTRWKDNYTQIAAAYNRALLDHRGTFLKTCTDGDNNCLRDIIKNYLSYADSCDSSITDGTNQCIYDTSKLNKLSGQPFGTLNWTASALKLNNKAVILFTDADEECDFNTNFSNVKWCGSFIIDVNGDKEPNQVGVDVFQGRIMPYGVIPVGSFDQDNPSSDYNSSSCAKSNSFASGWGCSALYISQ